MSSQFEAVVFDLGGVVLESPLAEIARFEEERGLPRGLVNRVVAHGGRGGPWARHERGELERPAFLEAFSDEFARRGFRVDTQELMRRVDSSIRERPVMTRALEILRSAGLSLAAVTNNWEPFGAHELRGRFDVFVESVVEGVRKPEPEIYRLCLARLGVAAGAVVMLDDIGANLKPARAMGMATIKVESPEQGLSELGMLLGLELV